MRCYVCLFCLDRSRPSLMLDAVITGLFQLPLPSSLRLAAFLRLWSPPCTPFFPFLLYSPLFFLRWPLLSPSFSSRKQPDLEYELMSNLAKQLAHQFSLQMSPGALKLACEAVCILRSILSFAPLFIYLFFFFVACILMNWTVTQ